MVDCCLVFGDDFKSSQKIWEIISILMRSDTVNVFNRQKINLSRNEVSKRLTKYFQVEFDGYEINLNYNANTNIYILYINHQDMETDWGNLLQPLFALSSFLQARIYDEEYNIWQNMEDIRYYEASDKDHSNLPKKNNGLPFPLEAMIIDTSSNPGRFIFKDEYIEFISAHMWFSKKLLKDLKTNLEELHNQNFVTLNDYSSYIEIKANDKMFIEIDGTEEKQNLLRQLIYPI